MDHFQKASALAASLLVILILAFSLLGPPPILNRESRTDSAATALLTPQPIYAIVIDDIGFSEKALQPFLNLAKELTFAVIPSAPVARATALALHQNGNQIIIHLPLEAEANAFGNQRTLRLQNSHQKNSELLDWHLSHVPYAVGVNNHTGSTFTADLSAMTWLLRKIQCKGLFFLDSKTTSNSAARTVAENLGMRWNERSVFLDNDRNANAILKNLRHLALKASHKGTAIGIGHPYKETAIAIRAFLKERSSYNASLAPLSRTMRRNQVNIPPSCP